MKLFCILHIFFWLLIPLAIAQEPKLPAGLGNANEPKLPTGLSPDLKRNKTSIEPALPDGISETKKELTPQALPALGNNNDSGNSAKSWKNQLPFNLSGFWEARGGTRATNDANERQTSIAETRLQLKLSKSFQRASFNLTSDLIYDNIANSHIIHLNSGRGFIDLREANLTFSPASFMDVKAGRQILTWGTGDLLFINDLFPKDWNAFFIGRDEIYLKAPSDAIKTSLFSSWANLDIVYTPQFDADRLIDGRRISYFSTSLNEIVGRNAILRTDMPKNDELALRLYRNFGAFETAAYFYDGYWKSPGGINPFSGIAFFPKLRVMGSSIRGPVGKGIGNIEVGYYDSYEDNKGSNPFVNNSEFRILAGYEQEVARNLTVGGQYYLEHMFDYSRYKMNLPSAFPERDQSRHLLTNRITLLTHNQNVTWSLFSFYSPSDMDFYLRPKINVKIDDHWIAELGANIFGGKKDHTLLNQFQNNTNIYLSIRYGF